MSIFRKALLLGALVTGITAAQATPINIGGVVWDPDSPSAGADKDFTARYNFNQWFVGFKDPSAVTVGDELTGTGEFTSWNGNTSYDGNSATGGGIGSFCPGCELTFTFGGLLVNSSGGFDFTSAYLRIYVGTGSDINYVNSANPLNISGASDGQLFLDLKVVDVLFTALGGNGYVNGVTTLSLEAVGGLAKSAFDTNSVKSLTLPLGFDLGATASAQFEQTDIDGNSNTLEWVATSTGTVKGNSIPEPTSVALAGLALLGIAGKARRRQNTAA